MTNIIVVDASDSSYEHLGLGTPEIIELRYRLYAVTEDEHGNRRVSRAASVTATGKTTRPRDKPDPRIVTPGLPQHVRAVAYSTVAATGDPATLPEPTAGNQVLHFYWTHPKDYRVPEDTADAANDWYAQVQRRVPVESTDPFPGWVDVTEDTGPTIPTDYSDAAVRCRCHHRWHRGNAKVVGSFPNQRDLSHPVGQPGRDVDR